MISLVPVTPSDDIRNSFPGGLPAPVQVSVIRRFSRRGEIVFRLAITVATRVVGATLEVGPQKIVLAGEAATLLTRQTLRVGCRVTVTVLLVGSAKLTADTGVVIRKGTPRVRVISVKSQALTPSIILLPVAT